MLQKGGVKFKVGVNYSVRELETFSHVKGGDTCSIFDVYGRFMNVEKFGPTCVWLYTFDILGYRIDRKLSYSQIDFIEEDAQGAMEE